ncbi:hypothetical protein GLAREA_07562 [Glarea lozoyensis ATCC 20868]|uniref:Secreted protein n=2 Tax=Glarea lozoyensis TaxID=101852 RepID=S3D5N0_GLAL2|nr:uncharacterized protein GLAREA_07562 [Glarea lozoyensis ATCC 20868]EHK96258.1 hypothetical protein M7I_8052 [Glarea lozoyensis 74030]EPE32429.1 hypothetical protein GLAREA_07562 [Glarea lozoyensis ATCC 20868]
MRFTPTVLSLLGLANFGLSLPADGTGGTGLKVAGGLPYPLEPFTFKGNIGGHDVELTGSIDEQIEYMVKTYPDFDRENFQAISAESVGTSPSPKRDVLGTNNKIGKGQCCDEPHMRGHNWQYVYTSTVQRAINELKNNDNNYSIEPSCKYLATYAEDIKGHCIHTLTSDGITFLTTTCGQQFDTDNYNVVVNLTK